ncbi:MULTISPECIES: thioesterase family protein [Gordonia]|uniref:thioesterase family protein n=1 Tax=Gordonia TaxID=2053 RepID=UPI0012BB339E|nr:MULTISPECIES: thioesterase family protein [Gordonia]MDH3006805.1 thioesterase family protein [Gordonia alkanivorans]MDH3016573.1 thioesterase family protein [Gordonia alkanivorans]MDH3020624.1 thioesterase family protein [Gordonia alkanivorans]MDH3041538.1 thioesterase family protein [Gordonia alkanivorans]MDH3045145.1 thioesterase family protein [Gordonia alkanivorans]
MPTLAELVSGFDPTSEFVVPTQWTQGRTAYGGLTAAMSVLAAQLTEGKPLPPLKSAQFLLSAPVVDAATFTARRLREGRSASSVAVETVSGGQIAAHASLIFAQPRPSAISHDLVGAPEVPAPEDCGPFGDASAPLRPAFVDNVEMVRAGGTVPLGDDGDPRFLAWVRHRGAEGVDPTIALVALADALPPATTAAFTEWAPISTMSWSLHICTDDLPKPTDWMLLESSSTFTRDGYSHQSMTLWDSAWRPIIQASQTVALFA